MVSPELLQHLTRFTAHRYGVPRTPPSSCRVEVWRGGLGRCLCSRLARSFVCGCHIISTMLRFHTPAHQTGRAVFPHPAFGQGLLNGNSHAFAHEPLPLRSLRLVQSQLLVQVLVRKAFLSLPMNSSCGSTR